jgi:hypothetical protein
MQRGKIESGCSARDDRAETAKPKKPPQRRAGIKASATFGNKEKAEKRGEEEEGE